MERAVNNLLDGFSHPDMLRPFRAVIQQYEPFIKIDENSFITFIIGLIIGEVIGGFNTVRSKDVKDINNILKGRLNDYKLLIKEEFSKYDVQLTEK